MPLYLNSAAIFNVSFYLHHILLVHHISLKNLENNFRLTFSNAHVNVKFGYAFVFEELSGFIVQCQVVYRSSLNGAPAWKCLRFCTSTIYTRQIEIAQLFKALYPL
jgi:hypothetical protein